MLTITSVAVSARSRNRSSLSRSARPTRFHSVTSRLTDITTDRPPSCTTEALMATSNAVPSARRWTDSNLAAPPSAAIRATAASPTDGSTEARFIVDPTRSSRVRP